MAQRTRKTVAAALLAAGLTKDELSLVRSQRLATAAVKAIKAELAEVRREVALKHKRDLELSLKSALEDAPAKATPRKPGRPKAVKASYTTRASRISARLKLFQ